MHELDSKLPVEPRPLDVMVSEAASTQRFTLLLLGLFAALAVTLALAGIYGVVTFTVGQRVQEIGLRMAIGASPGRVLAEVLRYGRPEGAHVHAAQSSHQETAACQAPADSMAQRMMMTGTIRAETTVRGSPNKTSRKFA